MKKSMFVLLFGLIFIKQSYGSRVKEFERYPYNSVVYSANFEAFYEGVYNANFPLRVGLALDDSFNDLQKNLLVDSFDIFFKRVLEDHVIDCAFYNADSGMPSSREVLQQQLYSSLSLLNVKNILMPSYVFVSQYNQHKSYGVGYVNLFYNTDKPLPDYQYRHYLYFGINSDYLNSESMRKGKDPEFWAGVIAHEVLHNLGYTHPRGHEGSFIYEYGRCLQYDGLAFYSDEDGPSDDFKDLEVYQ